MKGRHYYLFRYLLPGGSGGGGGGGYCRRGTWVDWKRVLPRPLLVGLVKGRWAPICGWGSISFLRSRSPSWATFPSPLLSGDRPKFFRVSIFGQGGPQPLILESSRKSDNKDGSRGGAETARPIYRASAVSTPRPGTLSASSTCFSHQPCRGERS